MKLSSLETKADEALPYSGPVPYGALPEIFFQNIVPEDDRLWVPHPMNPAIQSNFLSISPSQGSWVALARMQKTGFIQRHRHPHTVHALTIQGRWGYLEHDWIATAGSYTFEAPGDIHTLVVHESGEDMMAVFFNMGALIFTDEKGEATGYDDVFRVIERARDHYVKSGIGAEYVDTLMR